jgi:uncharacterized membrane protein YhaH (DUF805 family)
MPDDTSTAIVQAASGYQSGSEAAGRCEMCGGLDAEFLIALHDGLSQATSVTGRTSRGEYGYFVLAMAAAWSALFGALLGATDDLEVSAALGLAVVALPVVMASVRRLHDIGKSGSWGLVALLLAPASGISALVLLHALAQPGGRQANRYGPPQVGMCRFRRM